MVENLSNTQVWIRVKITEVRESVNEVDERVVPKGMLDPDVSDAAF